jgi:anthranilate 1,2-dioxygenase small subunit
MDNKLQLWFELSELQHRYVQTIDSDRLEQWPDFFTEDGTYKIISKENSDRGLPAPIIWCRNRKMMRDRIVALRHANIYEAHSYRHSVGGLVIDEVNGDEVKTTSSYIVVNTGLAGDSVVYQAGCYQDTVVKRDGVWRYKDKQVVYDTSRVQTLLATPI